MLRSDIRAAGAKPSLEERMKIQEKRELLQERVEAFHQQALRFIHSGVPLPEQLSLGSTLEDISQDIGESDEEDFFLDGGQGWEDEEDPEVNAENISLWLPSSFTKGERVQMGLTQAGEIEAELREGQANDALEALRAGLAEKSLRFRTEVRQARGQKSATRAWDSIHKADQQIKAAVRSYRLACTALKSLGVSSELLSQYKEIEKKDLKMSKDIVEENRVGQRSSELPWFWRVNGKWGGKRGEILEECKWLKLWSMQLEGSFGLQFTGLIGFEQKLEWKGGKRKWNW